MYFADWVLEYVKKQFKKVPKTVKVFGIHIRYHYATTSFISDGKQLVNVLFPFLDDYILNDKPYIFLTTTKSDFISLFQQKYSNRMFLSDVTKVADGKKSDAICDMCCVMMCDKMIGTYRSTFSLMAAMRSLMRAYYVTDEVDYIFRFTSSQAGLVSMVVDHLNYNYNPNFRTVVGDKYESGLRAFFYYFAI